MKKYLAVPSTAAVLVGVAVILFHTNPVAAQTQSPSVAYTSDGKLKLPTGYRKWVFVGAPLTPNALNGGHANFPEFHHVYVEERNLDAYLKTGSFPEGTIFIKSSLGFSNPRFRTVLEQNHRARAFSTVSSMVSTPPSKTASAIRRRMDGGSSPLAIIPCRTNRPPRRLPSASVLDAISPMSLKLT